MSDPKPAQHEATALLGTAGRMHTAVLSTSWRYVAWLTGTAVTTAMYFAGLGTVSDDPSVLLLSLCFAVCVGALSVGLLPGARATRAGFPRRWAGAVGGWGVLYGIGMVVGLTRYPGEPAFWLPAAVVVVLPLLAGARAELRA